MHAAVQRRDVGDHAVQPVCDVLENFGVMEARGKVQQGAHAPGRHHRAAPRTQWLLGGGSEPLGHDLRLHLALDLQRELDDIVDLDARELVIRGELPQDPRERVHGQPPDKALGVRRQLRAEQRRRRPRTS